MITKRGQITIFLIVGIVILALFATMFYFISVSQKKTLLLEETTPLSSQFRPQISLYVESCLRETAIPAIYLVGRQGGRIYPNEDEVLITEDEVISFRYLDGAQVSNKDDIANDLNQYIEENLIDCTGTFDVFESQGVKIQQGSPKASTIIKPDSIGLTLRYPLEVISSGDIFEMSSFTTDVPIRLGSILDTEQEIINDHAEQPFLFNFAKYASTDKVVVSFPFDSETSIFSIYDPESVVEGLPYYYWFAIKDTISNLPPELDHIQNIVLTEGTPFTLTVDATDPEEDALIFSSNSDVFPISEDGVFDLIPTRKGAFMVVVSVEDTKGNSDSQEVRFVVE
jgi:hypothetical protein